MPTPTPIPVPTLAPVLNLELVAEPDEEVACNGWVAEGSSEAAEKVDVELLEVAMGVKAEGVLVMTTKVVLVMTAKVKVEDEDVATVVEVADVSVILNVLLPIKGSVSPGRYMRKKKTLIDISFVL